MTPRQALTEIERLAREEIAPADIRAAATIILAFHVAKFWFLEEGELVLAQDQTRTARDESGQLPGPVASSGRGSS